jgi:hypothetical protein
MANNNPFARRDDEQAAQGDPEVYVFGNGHVCKTDTLGYAMPRQRSVTELIVDATGGFIPLWDRNVTLRWRFQEQSLRTFRDPEAAKAAIRALLAEALLDWGNACPVRFTEKGEAWDFEIAVRNSDDCTAAACVLASSFFPDQGQHELLIYPKMFTQDHQEQKETLLHELGHIFGLRHFFALVRERAFPAQLYGHQDTFTIMNYGSDSRLTEADRADLITLYQQVWSGQLAAINGTPIRLMKPFSSNRI